MCGGLGRGWTTASFPQLSRARSPFHSVIARGSEAAPEVRPAPKPGLRALSGVGSGEAVAGDFRGFRTSKGGSEGQLMPARLTGAHHRLGLGGPDLHPLVPHPPSRPFAATLGRAGGAVEAGLLAWRFVCIGPGVLRLQPPAPRAGWGGGGRTEAQSAPALAELGNGEGGQEAGGAELRGGGV